MKRIEVMKKIMVMIKKKMIIRVMNIYDFGNDNEKDDKIEKKKRKWY